MPKQSQGGLRSRRGCWTCRDRHKKCDEQRPRCRRCTVGGFTCAGYGVRLTWGNEDNEDPSGVRRPTARRPRNPVSLNRANVGDHDVVQPQALEHGTITEESDEVLWESFKSHGIYTLLGRAHVPPALTDELFSLCSSSATLRSACLAYHSNISSHSSGPTPSRHFHTALARYQDDLKDTRMLDADSTLLTGILLCSISIASVTPWTFHLAGLEAILARRMLIDPYRRTLFTEHVIEVIGLLDFPTVTIGAIDSKHQIWSRFVAPHGRCGIEPTSGLPRTLLDIVSSIERPKQTFETALLLWPSERGESYAQQHLWEAWRCAAVLNHRSLHCPHLEYPDTDVILMKIFASIEALTNQPSGPFHQALKHSIVYPLFVSSLHTADGSADRAFVHQRWQEVMNNATFPGVKASVTILEHVWYRHSLGGVSTYDGLRIANDFALQEQLEIHLY